MFAFNITVTTKPLFDQTSPTDKKDEQRRRNDQRMSSLLQMNRNASIDLPSEKNKYIVMADIPTNLQTAEVVATTEQMIYDQETAIAQQEQFILQMQKTIRLAQDGKVA